jgi:hypothetical protein
MNTYEKNLVKDTSFCGGLVAIAFAWIVIAGVQAPASSPAHDATMTAQNAVATVRG